MSKLAGEFVLFCYHCAPSDVVARRLGPLTMAEASEMVDRMLEYDNYDRIDCYEIGVFVDSWAKEPTEEKGWDSDEYLKATKE